MIEWNKGSISAIGFEKQRLHVLEKKVEGKAEREHTHGEINRLEQRVTELQGWATRELNAKVNLDTDGWVDVSLYEGFEGASGNPLRYRREGNVVYLRGAVRAVTRAIGISTNFGELPSGYAPYGAPFITLTGSMDPYKVTLVRVYSSRVLQFVVPQWQTAIGDSVTICGSYMI